MSTMIKKSRTYHPARRARWASIGVSVVALVGMVNTFNANAQAGLVKPTSTQPQPSGTTQVAPSSKVPASQVKVVYLPAAPVQPKVVVVHVIKHVKAGSPTRARTVTTTTQTSQSPRSNSQPKPAATHVVVNPVPVVQPAQPSQTTSGGSGAR